MSEESPHAILEEAGVAFDPTTQYMDLTKDEKRRTTALMLAIQGYKEIIIRDADYLEEMHNESRRENGPVIRPATMEAMLEAAIKFDRFIAGKLSDVGENPATDASQSKAAAP